MNPECRSTNRFDRLNLQRNRYIKTTVALKAASDSASRSDSARYWSAAPACYSDVTCSCAFSPIFYVTRRDCHWWARRTDLLAVIVFVRPARFGGCQVRETHPIPWGFAAIEDLMYECDDTAAGCVTLIDSPTEQFVMCVGLESARRSSTHRAGRAHGRACGAAAAAAYRLGSQRCSLTRGSDSSVIGRECRRSTTTDARSGVGLGHSRAKMTASDWSKRMLLLRTHSPLPRYAADENGFRDKNASSAPPLRWAFVNYNPSAATVLGADIRQIRRLRSLAARGHHFQILSSLRQLDTYRCWVAVASPGRGRSANGCQR